MGVLFAYYKGNNLWINIFKPISGTFLCFLCSGIFRKWKLQSEGLKHIGERSLYYYMVYLSGDF